MAREIGEVSVFFLQAHKHFFRLMYRSQIWKYVKQPEFKTRALTHRCAFCGLQHLNLTFFFFFKNT